ncbi:MULTISPECIES: hypothetical protein [unclassified Nocardioides]|uniref:hypothetical protein n=1 Tax=unclassified Nocardioides TaxID=2615069 RepID=UPI0007030605|nr:MULTISPECIES: hypothetical protein [unclassified Nocardioides]KQQ43467.1 hypothetical protein ASF50_05865 [Nocardioides sp. Leaf307]
MSVVDVDAILWSLVGGTVVALLALWIARGGRDDSPLWLVVLAGIAAAALGTLAHGAVYDRAVTGFDWWRHAWQLAASAIGVSLTLALLRGERTRHRAAR